MSAPREELSRVLERNIQALADEQRREEGRRSRQERWAEHITALVGNLKFIYVHAAVFGVWLLVNVRLIPGLRPFDPYPFSLLSTCACVEAIFLSTFVLITQRRMQRSENRRADLDLQVSLLSEHEVTRLIRHVDAIARHLGVRGAGSGDLEELKRDVKPESVLRKIDEAQSPPASDGGEPPH